MLQFTHKVTFRDPETTGLVLSCTQLLVFRGLKMTYFGNSLPEIYTTHEDYKPVIICVHCCQIPLYVTSFVFYVKDWFKDTFTASPLTPCYFHLGASFVSTFSNVL